MKFYFLIVVCLFVGYTHVVSWIFWSLSLMVLAGFLVRTYFIILNNKTIFDSGCEQICFKRNCLYTSTSLLLQYTRTNKNYSANCKLHPLFFVLCFCQTEWAYYYRTDRRDLIASNNCTPRYSTGFFDSAHLVNGVWVLAEVEALSVRFSFPSIWKSVDGRYWDPIRHDKPTLDCKKLHNELWMIQLLIQFFKLPFSWSHYTVFWKKLK